jgi:hypothetical protein
MPSMRAVLEARQKAAAVRVEELEAELERVRAALAEAEEVLGRRVIGLEQYLEALAEEEAPAVAVVSQRKPVGPRRAVPHRNDAVGAEVHRQQFLHQCPLRIVHVRAVPGPALWPVGRIPEPVGKTVTPRSGRTGPANHDHARLRQQGLLLLAGLDNRELPS